MERGRSPSVAEREALREPRHKNEQVQQLEESIQSLSVQIDNSHKIAMRETDRNRCVRAAVQSAVQCFGHPAR